MVEIIFVLKVMLYLGYSRLFRVGGRVAGKAEIITNSAQLGLELGLSLAKMLNDCLGKSLKVLLGPIYCVEQLYF